MKEKAITDDNNNNSKSTSDNPNNLISSKSKVNDFCFKFNLPKIENNGEDAEPICMVENDYVLLGTFDGLGGAGSQPITIDQETKSSAYFASRFVRECFRNFFLEQLDNGVKTDLNSSEISSLITTEFRKNLKIELDNYLINNKVPQSRLKSSLIKSIPTTIAAILIIKTPVQSKVKCYSFWAGDSRVYRLTPNVGLQQLTEDDLEQKGDAFENLRNDAKMSNFLTPDLDFKLNLKVNEFQAPSIFFACTDGCFDYLPTPMDFEFMLLETMKNSNSLENWCKNIQERLKNIPVGDDCSLSLWYDGWDSFQEIQKGFADRFTSLERTLSPMKSLREEANSIKKVIQTLDDVINQKQGEKEKPQIELDKKEIEILNSAKNIWNDYKDNYSL